MDLPKKVACRANGKVIFEGIALDPGILRDFLANGPLSQQKEMGYPLSYFGKNNFKEVPHAAGNDYQHTPSF
jgi:hypothetical protein